MANYYISQDTVRYALDREHESISYYRDNGDNVSDNVVRIPVGSTIAIVSSNYRVDGTITFVNSHNVFYSLAHKAEASGEVVGSKVYLSYPESHAVDSGDGVGQILFNTLHIGYDKPVGRIIKNTNFGAIGVFEPSGDIFDKTIEIPLGRRVKFGLAQIYTTLNNESLRKVNILIMLHHKDNGFIYKIIDDEFMMDYGGIMYGMSGSPIIQDGKLVGAVSGASTDYRDMGFMTQVTDMLKQTE